MKDLWAVITWLLWISVDGYDAFFPQEIAASVLQLFISPVQYIDWEKTWHLSELTWDPCDISVGRRSRLWLGHMRIKHSFYFPFIEQSWNAYSSMSCIDFTQIFSFNKMQLKSSEDEYSRCHNDGYLVWSAFTWLLLITHSLLWVCNC